MTTADRAGAAPNATRRALARQHHAALVAAEGLVNSQFALWRNGETTAVAHVLDETLYRWRSLGDGDRLVLDWPLRSLERDSRAVATRR